jgi:hypothetical protein
MSHAEDDSVDIEQKLLDLRVKTISKAAHVDYLKNPSGACKWCSEPVGVNRRFCDKECADNWEKYFE